MTASKTIGTIARTWPRRCLAMCLVIGMLLHVVQLMSVDAFTGGRHSNYSPMPSLGNEGRAVRPSWFAP